MTAALTRYRVLAYATGVFLLLLTTHVVLELVQSRTQGIPYGEAEGLGVILPGGDTWIAMVHGYLYLIYVIVTVDLWFRAERRLTLWPTIGVVLAGTIPLMSFVAERWVRGQVEPMLDRRVPSAH